MKKLLAWLLAALMVIGLSACSGTESGVDTSRMTVHDEVTGKVVIYTSMYQDIIDALEGTLADVFPNCEIEFFQGGTGTIQSKVTAELESGKLGCDMLMVAEPAYALELKELGLLHPYISAEKDNLAFDYGEEGFWYPVRISNMVLAYNPEMYTEDQVSHSLYDFAFDEGNTDLISMSNPLTSGTALASSVALYQAYGNDYFVALGARNVAVESGSVALTKLETGEYMTRYEVTDFVERRKPGQAIIEAFFTSKGKDLFAITPGWPGAKLTIKGVSAPAGMKASLLGGGELKCSASGKDVVVQMPAAPGDASKAQHAYVVKLAGAL
jgi:ABC-type thiamine transport system substrate-binding protein